MDPPPIRIRTSQERSAADGRIPAADETVTLDRPTFDAPVDHDNPAVVPAQAQSADATVVFDRPVVEGASADSDNGQTTDATVVFDRPVAGALVAAVDTAPPADATVVFDRPVLSDATVTFDRPVPSDATVTFDRPFVRDDATVLMDKIKSESVDVAGDGLGVVRTSLLAAPAMALAGTVSMVGAAHREMWDDEYATWHAITLGPHDFVRLIQHVDMVHALYYVFMHGWIMAFGDSPLAMRAPSIAATVIAAGALTMLGRRLVNTSVGVTAGLLFALIPSVSRYAQQARSYALVTMMAVVATVLLLRGLDRPRWRRWLAYGASLAALAWLNFVALLVLVPQALLFWGAARRSPSLRVWRWLAGVTILLLAALPLLSRASQQSGQISWITATAKDVANLPLFLFNSQRVEFGVLGAAIVGMLVLAFAHRWSLFVLVVWAVLPPVFCYATFDLLHLFLARYLLFTLPAWALLAAAALNFLAVRFPARRSAVAASVVLALAGVAILGIVGVRDQRQVRRSPMWGQPDYRAAAYAIRDRAQPGDAIAYNDVFGGRSGLARRAVEYELRNDAKPTDIFLDQTAVQRGWFAASTTNDWAARLGDTKRIWLMSTSSALDAFAGLSPARKLVLRTNFIAGPPLRFEGVRVFLLTRVPAASTVAR